MADRRSRHNEYKDVVPTRTRSGSEAIRKRVAHLLQDSGTVTVSDPPMVTSRENMPRWNSPSPHSNRNSSRERRQKPDMKDKHLSAFLTNPSRPLKRKKSSGWTVAPDRPENRNANRNINAPIASSSRQGSSRLFDALARPPPLDHDLPALSPPKIGKNVATRPSSHYRHDSRQSNDSDDVAKHTGKASEVRVFKGPLAAAEYDRMKKEIETLKEALQDSRKASKRNAKKLDETKAELSAAILDVKDKDSELSTIKDKCRKNEELLSTIETSVQCQICMDLPDNPFALSPCGHVLCLSCLQEWFRKAPPTLDDMDIDPEELTDPHYILMRTKSCPSCRAVVKRRPVPVFMVKAVTSALKKSKPLLPSYPSLPIENNTADVDKDNPWKGIFPSSEEESEDEDSAYSGDEFDLADYSDDDDEGHQVLHALYHQEFRRSIFANISSDSEVIDDSDQDDDADNASDEEGVYVVPRWAPPSVDLDPNDSEYDISEINPLQIKLLQRGCSWEMLENYDISYSHSMGIIVSLRSLNRIYASDDGSDGEVDIDGMNRVYLGWNVTLREGDGDGDIFMNHILEDIKATPARWQLTLRQGGHGAMDARRLVRADEVGDYDTTDTEVWIDAEDF